MRLLATIVCQRRAHLVTLVILVVPLHSSAGAHQPEISFDLGYVVECRDVTPQAFALLHPDERVVEANLRVSVRMEGGEEKDVERLLFEIASPGERLRVIDFLPRTQIEPEADDIELVKTSETIHSLGATVGATVSVGGRGTNGVISSALPAANATTSHRNQLTETTKKIPAGHPIVTSGTMENEHGVFFKLRRTAADTFEGIKPFSFRFAVPRDWRGDWLVLSCRARGTVKRYIFKSTEEIGSTKAFLALYLAGDAAAERAAFTLAQVQQRYLATKLPKDDHDLVDALASEARQLRLADSADSRNGKAAVTCLKPAAPGGIFHFTVAEESPQSDAYKSLKKSLERVARFSAAPLPYAYGQQSDQGNER